MSFPIIELNEWNIKRIKSGQLCCHQFCYKKIIELKTPVFITRYSIDDKYGLQIRINRGEISFDKFEEFDYFIRDMDKSTLFLTEKKKLSKYCPLISNDSFMNFHLYIDKIIIIDKNDVVLPHTDIESLKSFIPAGSNVVCFLKFDNLNNKIGMYGIKKIVTKIQIFY